MKQMLVIGGTSRHMQRWLKYVVPEISYDIQVDFYCVADNIISTDCVNRVYSAKNLSFLWKVFSFLPGVKGHLKNKNNINTLKHLILSEKYSIINIHQPAAWLLPFVQFAKKKGITIIVSPWGSEVLRCPVSSQNRIAGIFQFADYITCYIKRFKEDLIQLYHIEPTKFVSVGFGSEVFDLIPIMKGKETKEEMAEILKVPAGDYYIACGYTAQRAQRHLQMVEAIGENKDLLPNNTILLFQFTYGNNKDKSYYDEISALCDSYGLKYHFVTDYLSNEDMARFRLLTDLFIHIQPTDAGNASLQEFLLAGTQCINGKWLSYPLLEFDGMPYHICETLDDLSLVMKKILNKELPDTLLSNTVINSILDSSWSSQRKRWASFLRSI